MNNRKLFPLMAMAACFGLIFTSSLGDAQGRGRGSGGGSTGGSGGGGGQKSDPPRNDPPRRDPPQRSDPPRNDPPRRETPPPGRQDPPRNDPPRNDPPRREIPPPGRQDPPRNDPPRNDPPRREIPPPGRQDPPRNDPPRNDPPRNDPPNRQGPPRNDLPSRNDPPRREDPPRNEVPNRGGNVGNGQVGRTDPVRGTGSLGTPSRNQGNSENLLGKKSGSRSGSVQYGSNTNSRRDGNSGTAFRIDRAPLNIKRGSLGSMVRRSDHDIQINGVRIRFGYTHYDRRWCDDYFYYPHYVFDPCQTNFVFSPFYYYAHLPAYFNYSRCYFPGITVWQPFYGVRYRWNQPSRDYSYRDYNELDYVIDDIVRVFMDGDRRAINRLMPRRGNVGIIMDGTFSYALRADDFYDTLLDAAENSRTIDYRILDVQYRRDAASVFARHDFDDPWGRRTSVFHYYKLEVEGRDWVIREFGTNQDRW